MNTRRLLALLLLTLFPTVFLHAAPPADPFPVGSVWTGTRRGKVEDKRPAGKAALGLHVETREGEKFTGFILLRGTATGRLRVAVSGTLPLTDGAFARFATTEPKADFRARFEGPLKAGILDLKFTGTTLKGESVEGGAALRRNEKKND